MRRFIPGLIAVGILTYLVSDIGAGDGRKNASRAGAQKGGNAGSCQQQSPVIDNGGTGPGGTDQGTIEQGTGAQSGADEILVDDQGKVDDEILVDEDQNQAGLRRARTSPGQVLVNQGGAKNFTVSQFQVRRNNGEARSVPGIRLRSVGGKPLTLEQFRVRTASGEVKTVQGIRARTSSGKMVILPARQLRTSDGKSVTFVSPPKGSNLRVTHRSAAEDSD